MAEAHCVDDILQTDKNSIPQCNCQPGYGYYACQQDVIELKASSKPQKKEFTLQDDKEEKLFELNVSCCNDDAALLHDLTGFYAARYQSGKPYDSS